MQLLMCCMFNQLISEEYKTEKDRRQGVPSALGLSGKNSGAGQKSAMLVHVVALVDTTIE